MTEAYSPVRRKQSEESRRWRMQAGLAGGRNQKFGLSPNLDRVQIEHLNLNGGAYKPK